MASSITLYLSLDLRPRHGVLGDALPGGRRLAPRPGVAVGPLGRVRHAGHLAVVLRLVLHHITNPTAVRVLWPARTITHLDGIVGIWDSVPKTHDEPSVCIQNSVHFDLNI